MPRSKHVVAAFRVILTGDSFFRLGVWPPVPDDNYRFVASGPAFSTRLTRDSFKKGPLRCSRIHRQGCKQILPYLSLARTFFAH